MAEPGRTPGRAAERAEAVAAFALRTGSRTALREIEHLAAAGDPDWTVALGRVLSLGGGAGTEGQEQGLAVLDGLVGRVGHERLPRPTATLWAQLLLRAGRDADLATVVDDASLNLHDQVRWSLRTDLANPHRREGSVPELGGPDGTDAPEGMDAAEDTDGAEAGWLARVNEPFSSSGLDHVRLLPPLPGQTAYQRLAAPVLDRVDGDLVTVVMSAYRPDQDLFLAVRGVLEQTWTALELIVVDDASPPGYEAVLEQVAGLDPRVRVVRASTNGGTYAARNLAISLARGRWLTFQDSDDWTHPRRVELQARHLEQTAGALANRTRAVRAFPDLSLTYVGYPPARLNASSLMLDLAATRQLLGGFDDVRKSADLELPLRLEALRPGSLVDLRDPWPLAITQLRPGSLSRTDFRPGWNRWDRLAYRHQFEEWHAQLRTAGSGATQAAAGAHLPADPRPFPAPTPAWASDPGARRAERTWDVVVLADLRPTAPCAALALGIATTAGGAGLRTAMVHAEGPEPLTARREAPSVEVFTASRRGAISLTGAEEADEVDVLLVADPAALLHVGAWGLRPRRVVVTVHDPPPDHGAPPFTWSVQAVDDAVLELTGRLPLWGGPLTADDLRRSLPADRLLDDDLPVVIALEDDPERSGPVPTRAKGPVIGHHLPDTPGRWPTDRSTLTAAYPVTRWYRPTSVQVRSLRGLSTAQHVVGGAPRNWQAAAPGQTTVPHFLNGLDVWVYQGTWDTVAHVAALEALAAGLPLILPPEAAGERLGPAAVCVPAARVPDTLRQVWSDASPSSGDATLAAGRQVVEGRRTAWHRAFAGWKVSG